MNPKSRERAIAMIADVISDNCTESEQWRCVTAAEEALDALLAAGFHVAEWRKVEEADKDGHAFIAASSRSEESEVARYRINLSPPTGLGWYTPDGRFLDRVDIMDLPEPPKTEGDA